MKLLILKIALSKLLAIEKLLRHGNNDEKYWVWVNFIDVVLAKQKVSRNRIGGYSH